MQTMYSNLKRYLPVVLTGVFALLLTSCGSYYQAGYEDGIYESRNSTTANEASNEEGTDKANYYKQYFQSKANTFSNVPEEGAIFTDVEAYSTTESLDEEGYVVVEENQEYQNTGYGGWGTNPEGVTVNIYNTQPFLFNRWGWGWNSPFWYGGAWGPYWNWNNPYWGGIGWGWGWGWNDPFFFGGGFGWGWGNPFFGGAFCYPYYGGFGYYNAVAYNRGRRNLDYGIGRYASTRGRTNNSYSRSEINRRITNRGRPSSYSNTRPRTTRPRGTTEAGRPNNSRPNSYSRPSNSRPSYSRPSNSRPSYSRPSNSRPSYSRPSNSRPSYSRPSSRPSYSRPSGGSRGGSFSRGGSRRGGRG